MFKKTYFSAIMSTLLLFVISVPVVLDHANGPLIKKEMSNEVTKAQTPAKTKSADLHKTNDLKKDTTIGAKTKNIIISPQKAKTIVSKKNISRYSISRGGTSRRKEIQLLPWVTVDKLFSIGEVATILDVTTGLKIQVQRTYGHNHADVEALTLKDTETLKNVVGGSWNWTRRPVIVEINGYRIAGSITGMPHAGREDMPANQVVSDRSGGFGSGVNLDAVRGNGMDGHFDIHFLGSTTHGTNKVDEEHQRAIQEAYKSGK